MPYNTCPICYREHYRAADRACVECEGKPIPMLLFCPNCHLQHVDAPDPSTGWTNPVHKSHTCRVIDGGCGTVWRPADVPTTGVATIETRGKADTWPVKENPDVD